MTPNKVKAYNQRVCDYFGTHENTKGEVGLELETIGTKLPVGDQSLFKLWTGKNDASIKPRSGEMGVEYVLMQPVGRLKVPAALDELLEVFKKAGAKVAEGRVSNSTHVHINAQTLTIRDIYTWLAVYFIFEELLVRWAGKDREGNLFCLRAKDAKGLIMALTQCAKEDNFNRFSQKSLRYAAVNVMSLTKFGSLEFRALRGTADKEIITAWVEVLLAIKDKAAEYKDPQQVLIDFSRRGPIGFSNHVLPNNFKRYVYQQADFQDVMYEGARLAQDFAFSMAEWDSSALAPPPASKRRRSSQPESFQQVYDQLSSLTGTVQYGSSTTMITPSDWSYEEPGLGQPSSPAPTPPPAPPGPIWNRGWKIEWNHSVGKWVQKTVTPWPKRKIWSSLAQDVQNAGMYATWKLHNGHYALAFCHKDSGAFARWVLAHEVTEPFSA